MKNHFSSSECSRQQAMASENRVFSQAGISHLRKYIFTDGYLKRTASENYTSRSKIPHPRSKIPYPKIPHPKSKILCHPNPFTNQKFITNLIIHSTDSFTNILDHKSQKLQKKNSLPEGCRCTLQRPPHPSPLLPQLQPATAAAEVIAALRRGCRNPPQPQPTTTVEVVVPIQIRREQG